jgi:phosphoribosyl 1,2-cyclic phosphate phosphodiesterase
MLEIIILGCGASLGVPVIACSCKVCKSNLNYNKRTRSAIIIRQGTNIILVDCGFEIRQQLIKAGIDKLDAVIITHDHADHVHGIDNLRVFPFIQQKPLQIITDAATAESITHRYEYLFSEKGLITKVIDFYDNVTIGDAKIQFFHQYHGTMNNLGIKIGNFAYSNDISSFPVEAEKFLYNLKYWVLDCRAYVSNTHHIGLEKVLELNDKYKPNEILLTNMGHEIDYEEISKILPANIKPLYDGYIIKVENS